MAKQIDESTAHFVKHLSRLPSGEIFEVPGQEHQFVVTEGLVGCLVDVRAHRDMTLDKETALQLAGDPVEIVDKVPVGEGVE